MIKSTELRIGNLVNRRWWNPHPTKPSYEYSPSRVVRINADSVNLEVDKSCIVPRVECYPIKLTEDWLLKFGFCHDSIAWCLGSFTIDKSPNYWNIYIGSLSFGSIVTNKYVHELQNLYFALTGEELELKTTVQITA